MNPNPTVLQAAVYARVATSGQHEGNTRLDIQIAACQEYASNVGLAVPAEFEFTEEWPGNELDRPRFDDLRRLVREGSIAAVICYSTDRLSRNPIDLATLAQELQKSGCRLDVVRPVQGQRALRRDNDEY